MVAAPTPAAGLRRPLGFMDLALLTADTMSGPGIFLVSPNTQMSSLERSPA